MKLILSMHGRKRRVFFSDSLAFAFQDLDDDSPEVQQSVDEAHELLSRAKAQVLRLSRGAFPLQQVSQPPRLLSVFCKFALSLFQIQIFEIMIQ